MLGLTKEHSLHNQWLLLLRRGSQLTHLCGLSAFKTSQFTHWRGTVRIQNPSLCNTRPKKCWERYNIAVLLNADCCHRELCGVAGKFQVCLNLATESERMGPDIQVAE